MLTSSDAKFRCLWHMLVWSILMTLVSQFFSLSDHVVFYIFAAICNLLLPIVTSIYSTTAGRHGSGLLRVGYVFCDPVLSCITIIPVLLLNHLPNLIDEIFCLSSPLPVVNDTLECILNKTSLSRGSVKTTLTWSSDEQKANLWHEKRLSLLIVQLCLVFPALLAISMGRRTRKMNLSTSLLIFFYWFITGIEEAHMIETALLSKRYVHFIFTTETIVSVVMIIANSYSIVTLCSYISPMGCAEKAVNKRFDFLYKMVMGFTGILFIEIPQLVARCQILAAGTLGPYQFMSGMFYLWMLKDILFIPLILTLLLLQKMGPNRLIKIMKVPCAVNFDNPDVFFLPEKRDAYIVGLRHDHSGDKSTDDFEEPAEYKNIIPLTDKGKPLSVIAEESAPSVSNDGQRKMKRVTFESDYLLRDQPLLSKSAVKQDVIT